MCLFPIAWTTCSNTTDLLLFAGANSSWLPWAFTWAGIHCHSPPLLLQGISRDRCIVSLATNRVFLHLIKSRKHQHERLSKKTSLTVHTVANKDYIQRYKGALNNACSTYDSGLIHSGSANPKLFTPR
ncbi:unnamed protein product [Merluccius merluccius]